MNTRARLLVLALLAALITTVAVQGVPATTTPRVTPTDPHARHAAALKLTRAEKRSYALQRERDAWKHQAYKWRTERDVSRTNLSTKIRGLHAQLRETQRIARISTSNGRRDAIYALRLASSAYGVSYQEMYNIASCESHLNPYAKNRNSSASGLMQWLDSSWAAQGIAGFSVWDPVANAMAAARTRVRDGSWRQWACSP